MKHIKENKMQHIYKDCNISVINIVATFAVVMLHTNGIFWTHPKGIVWISANIIETTMYFAVPLFFMISGLTLINYRDRYSTGKFFKKRATRTVIPFVLWSIISIFHAINIKTFNDDNVTDIISGILSAKYLDIYWFFIPLFSLYLAIPVISMIRNKLKIMLYIVVYCFITISILPTLFELSGIKYNIYLTCPIANWCVMYAILGYYMSNIKLSKKIRIALYIFALIGLGFHFFGTIACTEEEGAICQLFKGYSNFPCVMYSIGVFVFFKNIDFSKIKHYKIFLEAVSKLQSTTLGVYLVHMYFIIYISRLFQIDVYSLSWRVAGPICIFILSSSFVYILKKIPIIRYLFP